MTKKHIWMRFDIESYEYASAVLDASGFSWEKDMNHDETDGWAHVKVYVRKNDDANRIGKLVSRVVKKLGREVFPHK